ncbi:E3 SUMO-protein ligase pias1 [Homalodisca vitripennis]|nr:E3 SUMO-protein ligase pias1 [Homalodisca vitripennis]
MAGGTILLKPQLVNVYVIQMRPQKLPNHRTVSVSIHCHSLPFLIFKKIRADDAARPKAAPNCHSLWIHFPFVNHERGVAQGQLQGPEGVQPPSNPPNAQATAALHQQMVQKNSMLNCPPTAAPAAYPTYQSQQQGRGQIYPGYYQPKTHTPPLVDPLGAAVRSTMPNNLPVHPDVQLKRLPFYDLMSELLKPSTLMPTGTARIQEQAFVFHLTPQQANDIAFHRDISAGARTDFIIQVQMRFCLLETSCEQEDFFPPNITVKVNGKVCPLPDKMSKRVTSNSPVSEGTIINSLIDGGVQVQDELSDDFLQNLSDSDAENDSDISVRAIEDNQSDVDDTDDDPDFILPSDNEELLDSEGDMAQISLPSTSTGRPRGGLPVLGKSS